MPSTAPTSSRCLDEEDKNNHDENDDDDDDPLLIFDWDDANAQGFLQRWEARDALLGELDTPFKRPTSLVHLYARLLEPFAYDVEGAKVIGHACIQCDSAISFALVANQMGLFEYQPWSNTIVGERLPRIGRLAKLYVTTSAHKCKPLKFAGKLF